MSQEPPRRKPSSPLIVREETAPGAIHSLRPVDPASERATVKPPPLPVAKPAPRTPTAIGMPVPTSGPTLAPMRDKLDSVEVAADGLFDLVAQKNTELAAKDEALAAKGEELLAAEATAAKLRLELDAAKVVVPTAPTAAAMERAERHVAWLKVAGAVVAILGAGTTYLSIRANSVVEPRVDNVLAKQDASKLVADTDHETQRKVLEYLRADRARRDCLDAQIVSALRRGTGHNVTSLTDPAVEWASQNLAPTKAPVLWERSTWFTVTPCATEPALP